MLPKREIAHKLMRSMDGEAVSLPNQQMRR